MFFLDIVNLYFLVSPAPGIIGRQTGCLLKSAVGKFFRVSDFHHHMGTGHLFGMKPPVISRGEFESQFIVLVIILAHIHMKAVTADIGVGPAGDFLLFCGTLSADIAALGEFLLDLGQVFFVQRDVQGGGYGFQMVDFGFDFFGQLPQRFISPFHLSVFIEIFCGIFRGGQSGIQRDGNRFAGIIIHCFQGLCTRQGMITVSVEKFPVKTVGFPLFRVFYLTQLEVVFFYVPFQGSLHNAAQIRGFLPDAGEGIFFRIIMLQQFRHGVIGYGAVSGKGAAGVQCQGKRGEFYRISLCVGDVGGELFLPDSCSHPGKRAV